MFYSKISIYYINAVETEFHTVAGFLKLVVRVPGTHASQLRTSTCHTAVVHRAYTPNDLLLLLFTKDLLVMGNQYFWWASKI
jgi:hypothetical protein